MWKTKRIALNPSLKKSKYFAVVTHVDGIRFSSKKEASMFLMIKQMKENGEISYFLRQCPIHLPANIKYVVDFILFYPNGQVRYIDCKGTRTPLFILKKKQVEALYPIKIEEKL
jgi:hypothetical protein